MILFFLSIFFLILKIFSFLLEIASYIGPINKMVIILILLEIWYLLLTFGLKKYIKLSEYKKFRYNFLAYYHIKGYKELLKNILWVLSYIFVFIFLLLWLRIVRKNITLDLREFFQKIKLFLLKNSILDTFLTLVIILLIIILYLLIMQKINKKFLLEITRLQIYLNYMPIYYKIFYQKGPLKFENFTIMVIQDILLLQKLDHWVVMPLYNSNILDITTLHLRFLPYSWKFLLNLHYFLLFFFLFKDLFFNNFILQDYFIFLPYFFIYSLWLRFSKSIACHSHMMDENLTQLLYGDVEVENGEIFVNGAYLCPLERIVDYVEYANSGLMNKHILEMYEPKKGKILTTLENLIQKFLSTQIIKRIVKYNYRSRLIKMHKRNIKIVKIFLIIIPIIIILFP